MLAELHSVRSVYERYSNAEQLVPQNTDAVSCDNNQLLAITVICHTATVYGVVLAQFLFFEKMSMFLTSSGLPGRLEVATILAFLHSESHKITRVSFIHLLKSINVWNSLPANSVDFSSFAAFKRTVQQIDFSSFLSC